MAAVEAKHGGGGVRGVPVGERDPTVVGVLSIEEMYIELLHRKLLSPNKNA